MKSISIQKQNKLKISTTLPGDKSISHRAVMMASLSKGKSRIKNLLCSEDCLNTVSIFKSLGVAIKKISAKKGEFVVLGNGLYGLKKPKGKLYCGNSGTTMRLMSGILSGQPFKTILTGDPSLSKRPMNRVLIPLKQMGANLKATGVKKTAPLKVEPGELKGGFYRSPIASAQVKSAVLFAGLYAKGKTSVAEPVISRDHTERFFRFAKIPIQVKNKKVSVTSGKEPRSFDLEVPGDISSAAFLIAIGILVSESKISLKKVLWNPGRTGIIEVLKRMRANIKISNKRLSGSEYIVDMSIAASNLKSTIVRSNEIPSLIDEVPILMVIATQAKGKTWFKGIQELRVKETDRVYSMVTQLKKMGASIGIEGDNVWVKGPTKLQGSSIKSFGDHRTAMSFIIAGMVAEGKTLVKNIECIDTSFPNFLKLIRESGASFKTKKY